MRQPAPRASQADLFGKPPASAARDNTPVSIPLVHLPKHDTDKALMLMKHGRGHAPGFAPRSVTTEGVGPNAGIFTMPKWLARERGWL